MRERPSQQTLRLLKRGIPIAEAFPKAGDSGALHHTQAMLTCTHS